MCSVFLSVHSGHKQWHIQSQNACRFLENNIVNKLQLEIRGDKASFLLFFFFGVVETQFDKPFTKDDCKALNFPHLDIVSENL